MKETILVIAAHPDDEVLGCGGTMARLVKEGNKVCSLILGEGVTARDDIRDKNKRAAQLQKLKKQAFDANKVLGVSDVFFYDFADNRFDTVALLDIVKVVEQVVAKIKPTKIFTHYQKDLNIDHQITYKATIAATRPFLGQKVREIYSYEVLSSTEWGYPLSFSPDTFFDISKTMDIKLKAMNQYKTELREFPHPRSLQSIKLNSKVWGIRAGIEYAEAFKCIRQIV